MNILSVGLLSGYTRHKYIEEKIEKSISRLLLPESQFILYKSNEFLYFIVWYYSFINQLEFLILTTSTIQNNVTGNVQFTSMVKLDEMVRSIYTPK